MVGTQISESKDGKIKEVKHSKESKEVPGIETISSPIITDEVKLVSMIPMFNE